MNKKKPFKKQFQLSEQTLRTALYVMVGMPFKEMKTGLQKRGFDFKLPDEFEFNDGLSWSLEREGQRYNVLWVRIWDNSIRSKGVLVHELLHFCLDEMKEKGIEVETGKANETICYLLEYYFTKCLENLLC